MQKRAIEYRRYSKDKQSNYSLERQAAVNKYFIDTNNVVVVDVFTDDGHSARNFDRPDVQRLFSFIKKNYRTIDYLIVAELTRFSRKLGEAIQTVEEIQTKYGIRIVSAGRGMVYDVNDYGSFINMSNEFTYGDAENRKRTSDITGGIRTAQARGQYVSPRTPYGYDKRGERVKELHINDSQAAVVQFIFGSYAKGLPVKFIQQQAKEMGYHRTGKCIIQAMLANPVYIGKQKVKEWKGAAAGLYAGNWEPIIDMVTWQVVQERLQGKEKKGISVSDNFPLRGVLRCYCGRHVTGAPSKSRNGNYYNYYKCPHSRHVNVSAPFAHNQLSEIMALLSVPESLIGNIYAGAAQLVQADLQESKKQLMHHRTKLTATTGKLHSLEEKFILNHISVDTYARLHGQYNEDIQQHQANIEALARMENEYELLTADNLQQLCNLQGLYDAAPVPLKHELLNTVFDSQLYYQDKVYRTAYIMDLFTHNELLLRQKQLLYVERKRAFDGKPGVVENTVPLSNRLAALLELFYRINAA